MTESECIEELLYQEKMRGKGISYQVNNLVIKTAVDALNEIQQYRAIGTVEECQGARERQRGKKWERGIDKDVRCPICGTCTTDVFEHRYCTYCGQRLV